jgi:hypothetical protein
MAARSQVPGLRGKWWLRNEALRSGTLTGIYLSCVLVTWLELANRVRELEAYAEIRNAVAGAALLVILAMPALRFRNEPARLFLAGLTAWTLLTVTYVLAELNFKLLESRLGFFHVFMLGVVSYGFVAVLDWVFLMCAEARQQHLAQSSADAAPAARRRTE